MFGSQSETCQFLTARGISTYCILYAEPKYLEPYPYCLSLFGNFKTRANEELGAIKGRMDLACGDLPGYQYSFQGGKIGDGGDDRKTGSEIKAILSPRAHCVQPLLFEAIEEYGCHAFNYPKIFELLKQQYSHLLNQRLLW